MIVEEAEVAGQDRQNLFAQKPTPSHPLIVISATMRIWTIKFRVGKFFFQPVEKLLMANMHAESHLRLLTIATEVALSD